MVHGDTMPTCRQRVLESSCTMRWLIEQPLQGRMSGQTSREKLVGL